MINGCYVRIGLVNIARAGCLILAALGFAGHAMADEPVAPSTAFLEERLNALDQLDADLVEAREQLESATTGTERRRLKSRIRKLTFTQDDLLYELQAFVGPREIAIEHEPPIALEERIEAQQRRHEAVLERDVEQRLPSD